MWMFKTKPSGQVVGHGLSGYHDTGFNLNSVLSR